VTNIQQEIQKALECYQSGDMQQAKEICKRILKKHPNNAEVLYFLGVVYSQLENHDLAIQFIQKSLQSHPNNPDGYHLMGLSFQAKGQLDDAMAYYRKTIEHNPYYAEAYNNLGNILKERRQVEEAIRNYQKAIEIKPDLGTAYYNLGVISQERNLPEEAADYYRKALQKKGIASDPTDEHIYHMSGFIFQTQGKYQEAVECFRKALQLNPDLVETCNNLGNVLQETGSPDEAEECYRQALRIKPDFSSCYSNLLLTMNYNARYDNYMIFSEHLLFAKRYEGVLSAAVIPHRNDRSSGRRLRIGYVSPDFRHHSVSYFIEPALRMHDRQGFEIFCYADVARPDDVTLRIQGITDHWLSIHGKSDDEVASMIRTDMIDILVDITGHTANNRILLFARKPAPVQVSWIGYPATTGLSSMDYKLVDSYIDPSGMTEQYYAETLVRIPESSLCYLPEERSPAVGELPCLSSGIVTFGSFNNYAKVSPEVIKIWIRILSSVSNARLIMKSRCFADSAFCQYVLDIFEKAGIASVRIILLPFQKPLEEHLDLYNRIDVGLDTFPYHGTTTTCEALWMGVPVVTLSGKSYAARAGVSLLSNVGLPELIAKTEEEYVDIAVGLANDPDRLRQLRMTLRDMMKCSPLTDAQRCTERIEQAFRQMWKQWCEKAGIL
jgi:predicted O-linked N-acetylglucosamine transferase (SPINDLY family)